MIENQKENYEDKGKEEEQKVLGRMDIMKAQLICTGVLIIRTKRVDIDNQLESIQDKMRTKGRMDDSIL